MTTKQKYEEACNEYVEQFSKKQGLDFDGWVADEIGGIACFIDEYFFNISDIKLDIDTEQPVGAILKWQNDNLEHETRINYYSFTKGLRAEHL